jgi:hypothetical protein
MFFFSLAIWAIQWLAAVNYGKIIKQILYEIFLLFLIYNLWLWIYFKLARLDLSRECNSALHV